VVWAFIPGNWFLKLLNVEPEFDQNTKSISRTQALKKLPAVLVTANAIELILGNEVIAHSQTNNA
jgi:hypothetical protein